MDKEYIETLIKKDIKTLGYDIWGIELLGSSLNPTLRIFIDNENGVTVEDCEKVSKHVSKVIEADDTYSINSTLEVSSPGLDRPLFTAKQFEQFIGSEANMRTRHPVEGRRKFKGLITGVNENFVALNVDGLNFDLEVGNVEKANIVFD